MSHHDVGPQAVLGQESSRSRRNGRGLRCLNYGRRLRLGSGGRRWLDRGLAFLPWSPLGGLGGARRLAEDNPGLRAVAERRGVSVYRVALAWLLGRGPHVLPIPGASRKETIADSAQAADLELSAEEIDRI